VDVVDIKLSMGVGVVGFFLSQPRAMTNKFIVFDLNNHI
jgi:hypothetical protein